MKQLILIAVVILTLSSCEKQKIGFVDNGKVINEIQEKKDLEAKYTVREDAFNVKADSLEQAIQFEAKEFQLKAAKMSQSNQEKSYQELVQKKQIQDQRLQFEKQQIAQAYRKEMDSVIVKMKDFVSSYGKTNGYNYILGTSDVSATVLYGEESNDLTQVILDAINAEYKK